MTDGKVPQFPKYRCHKTVQAGRIQMMHWRGADCFISFSEPELAGVEIRLLPAYMAKHDPQVGGYYVLYADGYESFSPAKAFENGYTRLPF